jgi:hypothetical protein
MTTENPVPTLLPGDHLIYWTNDLVDWVIAVKTFSRRAGHIEIYHGDGMSLAARAGGVNYFPLRLKGLQAVVRPCQTIDLVAADKWFKEVAQGKPYDWAGLLSFSLVRDADDPLTRFFCSKLATLWGRAAGLSLLQPRWPANLVEPGMFLRISDVLADIVWDSGGDSDFSGPYAISNVTGK